MIKRNVYVLCAILICLAALVCGCSTDSNRNYSLYYGENVSAAYYFSMNSDALLTVYSGGSKASKKENAAVKSVADGVYDILEEIERAVSVTEENSDISRFNAANAGEEIEISQTAYNVIRIAKTVYAQTNGYYNPAVYYGVQAFCFNGSSRYPKTVDELPEEYKTEKYADLASHFSEVELEEREGKFYLKKPTCTVEVDGEKLSLKIDLGGIGKGYATDVVSAYLDEQGFDSAIFNFGGSSIAAKTYRGGDFTFDFADPRPSGEKQSYISNVSLKNQCVSSSGDYVHYFEIDGVRYSHIFDPFTARPTQSGVMTATMIGGSAAENDGFTTAIMAMGYKKAVEFIKNNLSDRRVAFTFADADEGSVYYYFTNMPDGSFTATGERYIKYTPAEDGVSGGGDVA